MHEFSHKYTTANNDEAHWLMEHFSISPMSLVYLSENSPVTSL